MTATRATVTLCRDDKTDAQRRQIYVRLDDAPSRTLLFGDVASADVAPGTHRLRANNTLFWKSLTFSVEAGEHVEFVLINRARWLALGFLVVLGAEPLTLSIQRR